MKKDYAPALAGSRQVLARLQAEADSVRGEIERLTAARQKIDTVISDCNAVEAQAGASRAKHSEALRAWATRSSADEEGEDAPESEQARDLVVGALAMSQERRAAATSAALTLASQADALAKRLGEITTRIREYALKALTEDTEAVLERLRVAHDVAAGVEAEIDAVRVLLIEAAEGYFRPAAPEPDASGFLKPQVGGYSEEVQRSLLQAAERLLVEVRAAKDGASSNTTGRHVARRAKWSALADRLEYDASATVDDGVTQTLVSSVTFNRSLTADRITRVAPESVDDGVTAPPVPTILDDVVLPAGFLK